MHKIFKILVSYLLLITVINTTTAKTQLIHPKYRKHPSHAETFQLEKLNVYGYVDGAYNYLSNRNRFISNAYNRFD